MQSKLGKKSAAREIQHNSEGSKRRFSQMNPNGSMGSLELSGENLLNLPGAGNSIGGMGVKGNYSVRAREGMSPTVVKYVGTIKSGNKDSINLYNDITVPTDSTALSWRSRGLTQKNSQRSLKHVSKRMNGLRFDGFGNTVKSGVNPLDPSNKSGEVKTKKSTATGGLAEQLVRNCSVDNDSTEKKSWMTGILGEGGGAGSTEGSNTNSNYTTDDDELEAVDLRSRTISTDSKGSEDFEELHDRGKRMESDDPQFATPWKFT